MYNAGKINYIIIQELHVGAGRWREKGGRTTEDCAKANYHRGCGGSPPMKMFKSMLVASGACMIADDIKKMLQRCIQNPKWFKQLALYMVLKFPGWWKSTTFFVLSPGTRSISIAVVKNIL